MKVSLIIPVYNEARHLREFFEQLFAAEFSFEPEFVVINDCSTDNSWSIIQEAIRTHPEKRVTATQNSHNMGKGASIRSGIRLATGQIITIQDADFEYAITDLNQLVEPILRNKADVVYGSRFHRASPQVHRTFHYVVNRL